MNTGPDRIELNRLAGVGHSFSGWSGKSAMEHFWPSVLWLPAALISGLGIWMALAGYASDPAGSEPAQLATAVVSEPAPPPSANPAPSGSAALDPAVPPGEAIAPAPMAPQLAPVDGLRIASQSWRRGGLGSKALVTFTLRNGNDYAVKDIEISCAFTRRDGSHLTDRKRIIPDTVAMKSRKTFARMHVGFVNVNATRARCSLVTASRM